MTELLTEDAEDVLIVRFASSRIINETTVAQVGRELLAIAEQATGKLLLDFSHVSFMSSAVLGKLLQLHERCKRDKAALKLCRIDPAIFAVFKSSGLNRVFSIYDTREDALKAFQKTGWFR
jgi:anti-sigma B factor antagonist